jgi:acetoin utilization deacetylase AcuC-like enzyme
MLNHSAPNNAEHPERPERVRIAFEHLGATGLLDKCEEVSCTEVETKHLLAVHDERHINYVDSTAYYGDSNFIEHDSGELYVSSGTARAARLAAGGLVELAIGVARGELANGFALIRPPGHHCSATQASGFCFFNNVAVAARAVQACGEGKRVAILDWDVHHCNGTESIFFDDPSVLVISLHQHFHGQEHRVETKKVVAENDLLEALELSTQQSTESRTDTPKNEMDEEALEYFHSRGLGLDSISSSETETKGDDLDSLTSSQVIDHAFNHSQPFYPGTGTIERIGSGGAEGTNINIPWPCVGFGDAEYLHVLEQLCIPVLQEFSPDIIFISCGFDCAAGDLLGSMKVTPTGFYKMTSLVKTCCPRVVVALEGGYNTAQVALGAEAVLRALLDESNETSMMLLHQCDRTINAVKASHASYWKCLRKTQ